MNTKLILGLSITVFFIFSISYALEKEEDSKKEDKIVKETPTSESKAMSPSLKSALEYFENRDYPTASLALYEALANPDNSDFIPRIHFSLARSLEGMHLYQSALFFYAEAIKCGSASPYFEESFLRAARLSRKMEDSSVFLDAVLNIPPEEYPVRERGFTYYIIARHLFENEKYTEAKAYLGAIPVEDAFYDNSRHLLSVILTAERRYREAVTTYLTILALPDSDQEREDLKILAIINLGRIFYAHKNFDRSIEFFKEIDRDSPYWTEVLFETAWSYFMKTDYNGALSQLQTITSPFFKDFYIPEAELLRIIILYYTCKFADGTKILDTFIKKYTPFKEKMKSFLEKYGELPAATYDIVAKFAVYPDNEAHPLPWGILNLFLMDERLKSSYRHILKILVEKQDFSKFGTWGDSELRADLAEKLDRHIGGIKQKEGTRVLSRLKEIYSQLVYFMNQSHISQLEMIMKEKEMYESAMFGRVKEKELIGKVKRVPVLEGYQHWPFEGEFWIDELGFYVVSTEDECPEFGMETKEGTRVESGDSSP